jgi:uncharacterized membrane protein
MAGETTAAASLDPPYEGAEGFFLVPFTVSYSTTQNELADVMELGYLPSGVKVFGAIYTPSAMAASALVHKITIGSTDVVTGLTGAVAGTSSVQTWSPVTLTAKTLASVTSTTAAVTPAAGTLTVSFLCQK